VHCFWLAVILLSAGLLAWTAFLYLGLVTRYRRWMAWAVCYLAVAVVSFSLLVAGGSSNSLAEATAEAVAGTLLWLGLWTGSSVHGFLVRKEALVRLGLASERRRMRARNLERDAAERRQSQRVPIRPVVEPARLPFPRHGEALRDPPVRLPRVEAAPQPQPAETPRSAAHSEPRVIQLIAGVAGGAALGVCVFIGLLTLAALGGGSYNHYIYPHDWRVIVWISGVSAVAAIIPFALGWLIGGRLSLRRLVLTGAASAAALAAVGLSTLWASGPWAPTDPRPTTVVPPSVSGIPRLGGTLTVHPGIWRWPKDVPAATDASRFRYQWERCEPTALHCVPIPGATNVQYVVVPDDESNRVRVSVTAANDAGSHETSSESTSVIDTRG
jgi:hypothetical protein